MATVIHLKGDERAKALGENIGDSILNVVKQRAAEKEKEKKKAAIQQALTLFSAGMGGQKKTEQIPQSERSKAALSGGQGPTKEAARAMDQMPTTRERTITGKDVAGLLINADVDEKFAFTIAAGLDEANKSRLTQQKQAASLTAAMTAMAQSGTTREEALSIIGASDLDADTKITMMGNIDKFFPEDKDEETDVQLFTKDGESITVKAPKEVESSQAALDNFVKTNFPDFTARPVVKPSERKTDYSNVTVVGPDGQQMDIPVPKNKLQSSEALNKHMSDNFPGWSVKKAEEGEETIKERGLKELLDAKLITPEEANKHRAGLIRITNPDQTGRFHIVDLSNNEVISRGGEGLTQASLVKIEGRMMAINDAINILEKADPSKAGIANALAGEVGGIAVQIPVVNSIAMALGLDETEIAEIQVGRAGFWAALTPLAQSFASGGGRSGVATNKQLDIAQRVLNMTRMASSPATAALAKTSLIDLLKDIQSDLQLARDTRRLSGNEVIEYEWYQEDGVLKFRKPGEQ